MSTTTTTAEPRIYVACLAAYNNGRLHGEWIDADQTADAIYEDVKRMLAASPEPGAEEWAIHDYEGFGKLRLSEWESFERVAVIAGGIAEHGDAFTAWLSYDPDREAVAQAFEDAYRGEWTTLTDYAAEYADAVDLYDAVDRIDSPYVTVNIDLLERDLEIDLYTVESDHDTIYVFDPS